MHIRKLQSDIPVQFRDELLMIKRYTNLGITLLTLLCCGVHVSDLPVSFGTIRR